jgi:hypothetical protein
MLGRIDGIDADIAVLEAEIEAHLGPFQLAAHRLDEIPGIGPVAAAVIIAEIGVDMTRFPTAGHLCSWAKFSPGIKSSAGRNKGNGSTGHGGWGVTGTFGSAWIGTSLASWARPRPSPGALTPSSVSATVGSRDVEEEEGHRRGRSLHVGHHLAPTR